MAKNNDTTFCIKKRTANKTSPRVNTDFARIKFLRYTTSKLRINTMLMPVNHDVRFITNSIHL